MIKCPECGEVDSIAFEGVVSIPVIEEPDGDGTLRHVWDWDYAEVVVERCYLCTHCGKDGLDPDDFVYTESHS